MSDKQKKISIIEEIQYCDEDMSYEEEILYLQLNMFNAFNNVYNILKQLQKHGYNIDEVMKEFISFYNLAKSENPLRARKLYKTLYNMLNDIKDNVCEGEVKEQLDSDIHKISSSLGGLTTTMIG
ncbi:MAG: hypothetical protein J6D47_06985 [Peptostreptococcaceae bacterium]|nr:hypothetical protein [Peptostreptococcaceae bacterium]